MHVADGIVHHGDDPIAPRTAGMYGIAIDVGTTTVALELVDLDDGRILEVVALENPQRFGGSDVMNRISYDDGPLHGQLRQSLRKALNKELRQLYERCGIDRREVFEVVVVGNATMRDLFFGLDVAPIGQRPYKSTTELDVLAGIRATTDLTALAHDSASTHTRRLASGEPRSSPATSAPTWSPISWRSGSTRPTTGCRCWSTSVRTRRS